ncbi:MULTISPECIES: hypothetical protein [Flavobacterium]|uniref:Uncharacterized protein n=1 Tax=Flavobacterium sedimenticola TaxID=3043286 RepID=A0ABT6XTA9_9FLAO|nr:hypothetical protein [Flavobacterium sedimenticola]MDI9258258.1 hypothetical protein [Flavobacterium sedimenticola]
MKKSALIYGLLLSGIFGYAQNTFPTGVGTNVGIGTTSPSTRLQITSATAGTSGVRLTNMTSATATTTGNSKALSVDSNGNIILTPVLNTASSAQNIYNTDGTLTSNRNISLNSFNLNFNVPTAGSNLFINGTNGNVGIGNVLPTTRLDVTGGIKAKTLWASNTATSATSFPTSLDYMKNSYVLGAGYEMTDPNFSGGVRRMINFYDYHAWSPEISANDDLFSLNIVDRNNKERLVFYGNKSGGPSNGQSNFIIQNKNAQEIFKLRDDGNDNIYLQMGRANSRFILGGYGDYAPGVGHKLSVQGGSAFIEGNIITHGNIGIGSTTFVDGSDSYRLSVKGALRADRVRVYTTWADYVFFKDYSLPSLEEVEQHIKVKGHLKDIPSAKEVEANGIELGEMNKLLLQKIEELTLYMIEMNKEITALKSQIKN